MKIENNKLNFQIEDDGIGFIRETVRDSALGLKSMKERIELMKGTFRIRTKPGQGTKIEIQLPV